MARTGSGQDKHEVSADAALVGVLALLVDERERATKDEKDAVKTEVLLSDAGLSTDDIAAVTGKKRDAVRKTIERARAR